MKSILYGLILLSFFITACHPAPKSAELPVGQEPVEVSLAIPFEGDPFGGNYFLASGKLESSRKSSLSSRVMGNIVKMNVREGQKIKKGQTLVVINSTDLRTQREKLTAVQEEAKAALQNAQRNFERYKNLFEQKSATAFEFDQAKMNYDIAKSKIEQVRQSKAQMEVLMSEANVVSPFDGAVTEVYAEEGAMASPGMPILTVETAENLVVKVLVPESEIRNVRLNQTVQIKFHSSADTATGKIKLMNPSSGLYGSQYEVEIALDAPNSSLKDLKPGMFASAIMKRENKMNSGSPDLGKLFIPKRALIEKGQLNGIYTVSDEHRAILRWVRTGKEVGDKVEILSGIKSGEQFVAEADSRLFNGAPVAIK